MNVMSMICAPVVALRRRRRLTRIDEAMSEVTHDLRLRRIDHLITAMSIGLAATQVMSNRPPTCGG